MTSTLHPALVWLSGCTIRDLARACSVTPVAARRWLIRRRIFPDADGLYRAPWYFAVSPAIVAAVGKVCARGGPLQIREAMRRSGYAEAAVRRALRVLGWRCNEGRGAMWRAP